MALTHVTTTRNAMCDACVDRIDLGTTDATGDLITMTSGDVEVSAHLHTNPAYGNTGAVTAGLATAAAIGSDVTPAGGTMALYKQQDRDNGEVMRGTITATSGGGDIEFSSIVIAVTDTVQVDSLTYTAST